MNGSKIVSHILSGTRNCNTLSKFRLYFPLCYEFWNKYEAQTPTRSIHLTACSHVKRKKERKPIIYKKSQKEKVEVYRGITIAALAEALNRPTDHVYEVLSFIPDTSYFTKDHMRLESADLINEIVYKSGRKPIHVSSQNKDKVKEDKDIKRQDPPDPSVLVKRPPIVAIMGHVDHGKTTLLDRLRDSRIVDKEFGGITQHIGAFKVNLANGESVCFLDTPGHAAFSAMRSRGAQLTDIVVLVVAAEDGVMQQTLESISYAQEAGVPIIVAINKIDKYNSDIERTKQMLLNHQLQLEDFGGDVQAVPISALKGTNIDGLLDALVTESELLGIKGDPVGKVEGKVVESRKDIARGQLATVLVHRGTLKKGDVLVAGLEYAKVKIMHNDRGEVVEKAPPGTPVEVMGWKGLPRAGEDVFQADSESHAKTVLKWRQDIDYQRKQEEEMAIIELKRQEHYKKYRAKVDARLAMGFHRNKNQQKTKEADPSYEGPLFSMILKGDVDGSLEAISDSLATYDCEKCRLDMIHSGVGPVTESDIDLAATFNGKIYAFNIPQSQQISALAKEKGVTIVNYNIIYRLFEDIKEELNKRLPCLQEDENVGIAKVLQIFHVTTNKKKKYIAGARCTDGVISKKFGVKVLRNEEEIFKGTISSLKHFKDEVVTVKKEMECGIVLSTPDFIFQPQDEIVCFEVKDVPQEITWNLGWA